MMSRKFQHIYFFVIFVLMLFVMYLIFKPFVTPLFISLICAVMFESLHQKFLRSFGGRRNIAAFATVISVLVLIIIPLSVLGVLVFNEARNLYASLGQASTPAGYLNKELLVFQTHLQHYIPQANIDLQTYIQDGLQWVLNNSSLFVSSFLKIVLDLFIMVVALFYLFRDGKELRQYFKTLSPLEEKEDEDILNKLELTINSVVKGNLVIALLQGICTTIGLYLFGVNQPLLWGLVAAVVSLVPGIGTGLLHIPLVIFLFVTGETYSAIGYAIWSTLLTGSIDNIVSPLIIERRVKIHPLLILVSVLGGLVLFGPIGFLAGPVVLAFAIELLKLYPKFARGDYA